MREMIEEYGITVILLLFITGVIKGMSYAMTMLQYL